MYIYMVFVDENDESWNTFAPYLMLTIITSYRFVVQAMGDDFDPWPVYIVHHNLIKSASWKVCVSAVWDRAKQKVLWDVTRILSLEYCHYVNSVPEIYQNITMNIWYVKLCRMLAESVCRICAYIQYRRNFIIVKSEISIVSLWFISYPPPAVIRSPYDIVCLWSDRMFVLVWHCVTVCLSSCFLLWTLTLYT